MTPNMYNSASSKCVALIFGEMFEKEKDSKQKASTICQHIKDISTPKQRIITT